MCKQRIQVMFRHVPLFKPSSWNIFPSPPYDHFQVLLGPKTVSQEG